MWSHCYQGLWVDMYQTHITRPIKLLPCTVCVSLQTPTIVRACAPVRPGARRAPVSARLWKWVTMFGLEHMDSKVLQFTNSSHPGWSVHFGSFLQHPTEAPTETNIIKSKSSSDTNTVWVWLVESTIAMGDIYVSCMLCSTVMLTSLFHLSIIVYLIYKFFN